MKLEHLSGSRIGTYNQCQMKYYAHYELGKRGPTHALTKMGSGIHSMFENATLTHLGQGACESFDPHWYTSAAVKEFDVDSNLKPLMKELTQNGLDWGYFRNVKHCVGSEIKIDFELPDGTKVTGFIDRLDVKDTTANIIDLKTQKREFTTEQLNDSWQARIYNIGSRKLFPQIAGESCVSFWLLRHRVQKVFLDEKDVELDTQRLVGIAEEIRACKEPKCSPSALCPWCPLHKECDASKEGIKSRFKRKR